MEKNISTNINQLEFSVHHTHGFPIGCITDTFHNDTCRAIHFHWHEEFQYHYITKGSFLFQVGDKKTILYEGEGIVINSEKIHRIVSLEQASSYLLVYFHPRFLSNEPSSYLYDAFVAPILKQDRFAFFTLSQGNEKQKDILDQIHKIYQISLQQELPARDLLFYSQVIQLWRATFLYMTEQEDPYTPVDPFLNRRLQHIFQYIESHYEENITLDDVADFIHLSSSECSRFFRRAVGEPLFRYIISYRVHRSLTLLIHTDLPIAEIAEQVGFNSQSYFTTRFSELKQISPQQFRKEYHCHAGQLDSIREDVPILLSHKKRSND